MRGSSDGASHVQGDATPRRRSSLVDGALSQRETD